MITHIRPAIVLLVMFTVLTGVIYPLALTAVAQIMVPGRANGSLIVRDGHVTGSELIGQRFTSDRYFYPRPSAAGQDGYDAAASSGSNLGPLSGKLLDRVKADVATLKAGGAATIPADAVTASASGLDPHISPAHAMLQSARVAAARGVEASRIQTIIEQQTATAVGGVVGEPRVNILSLNIALDEALKRRTE